MTNYFEVLGLAPAWGLSRDALEDAYLAQSRQWHPDRHAGGEAAAQREAMERSAQINEACATLRDPVRRAEYLVKLAGRDLDSSDPQGGAPQMDQAFLIEMIERREALAAAASAGPDALADMRERVETEHEEVFERAVAALGAADGERAARELIVARYLRRLLEELDAAEERA